MISKTKEIEEMLNAGAAVAMAISGGKDSSNMALELSEYLDSINHPKSKRVLIHSDLGSVEWKDSIKVCERLAERLNLELIVVSRKAGGMMDRWRTRWANNVKRYVELSCVKMILPWSTPSMRFCTSELKTAVICSELTRRFPGQTIINAVGIRRAESNGRKNAPVMKANAKLARSSNGTRGFDWNPIIENEIEDVFLAHKRFDFPLHEAYTKFGSSRVSCVFCIMSNKGDLIASTMCEDNADIYREMCELEIESAFSFQSAYWLSDVAPHLLSPDQLERLERAKIICARREEIEARIPKHLLYTKNFPDCIPTFAEAELLCEIRREVAALHGLQADCLEPASLIARYEVLMREKLIRQAKASKK